MKEYLTNLEQSTATQEGMPEPKPSKIYIAEDSFDIMAGQRAESEGMVAPRIIIPAEQWDSMLRIDSRLSILPTNKDK